MHTQQKPSINFERNVTQEMCVYPARKRNVAALFTTMLLLAASASAQTAISPAQAKIRIKNFGRINENYYRGAQPEARDWADLKALGVKTVIDLTKDGRSEEGYLVERAGMKFYRIPMTTDDTPSTAQITQFLKLVNDPANFPVYVHCQGGRHRTGAMTAVYRMTNDGWSAERAYQEMKQYHFEGFPGHPVLKSFVYDYSRKNEQPKQVELDRTEKAGAISK
jgi:protein tyrosine/serine phosphatase